MAKAIHQQRSCIVCRKSTDKRELLRFVWKGSELCWDKEHNIAGRGAYVHRKVTCWSKMRESNRWEHAFRLDRKAAAGKEFGAVLANLMEQVRPEIEGLSTVDSGEENRKSSQSRKRVRI